ncbi:hypothetical protein NLU13_9230 [Sarocladium strictum]|uniref:LIM zinc-binding domain-containing protein n=1 Tax=Sarocladium strictum TaxID=5046 RepID=A0AA39G9Q3_SARSR|nr:hypothetical protein NLU13_9230 [Sarocladium strictum]
MRAMGRANEPKANRKVTPPSPSYMSNDQFANYLAELRSNRVARPGGARPQPASGRPSSTRFSTGRLSLDTSSSQPGSPAMHQRTPSQAPSIGAASISSRYSTVSGRGRDYYPAQPSPQPLKPSEVVPSATYMERGQRWMEKEEAYSLRDAMEEMDIRSKPKEALRDPAEDDESRIYNAALDEAAELVWQHQNGGPTQRPEGPYRYRPHLRKNSYAHARTASVGQYGDEITPSGLARNAGSRSVSGSSTDSDGMSRRGRPSLEMRHSSEQQQQQQSCRNSKSYGSVGSRTSRFTELVSVRRRSSMKRNISGEVEKPFSGDQIWEETETASTPTTDPRPAGGIPAALQTANPANRVRFNTSEESKPLNRVEIHKNPPTRSRDAQYTINNNSPVKATPKPEVPQKDGKEIRSQDIREATSMKLKDRSPRLPEPTAVSDTPGRPIVSFDANWRAPEECADVEPDRNNPITNSKTQARGLHQPVAIPSIVVAEEDASREPPKGAPSVPTICVGDAGDSSPSRSPSVPSINIPTIAVDEPDTSAAPGVPAIVKSDDQSSSKSGARPLPSPGARSRVPRAQRPKGHWSPDPNMARRHTALCHECGFPIEGRFVALAGCNERFHPQCLSCFCCGTRLEAMEIRPEPDTVRAARVDRIRRRDRGEVLPEEPGETAEEDGDDRLRFFCHLDWHESFAPRCKHCRTPILGEHIVALGEHWHYGHFFCAECGDPFEHGMTHIEKDGYAWCINCQTKRTERRAPKCKKCRVAVIGEYIQALGGEWHEGCFRCATCQGGFEDGQIFPTKVEEDGSLVVVCTGCRMKELKG